MQNALYQHFSRYILLLLLTVSATCSHAANTDSQNAVTIKALVSIKDAWVRQTNAGQEVGAAYMTLSSTQDATLVGVESDVSKSVEIHSMTMQNGVMKMRMLDSLPLRAGKPYKLAPGGFHLMLFDLKKPLTVGEQVNFVLHFRTKDRTIKDSKSKDSKGNVEFKQNIQAKVQSSADDSAGTDAHSH